MFTEFVNEMVNAGGVSDEKIVADLIMSHNNLAMIEGVRYYNNENDILRRKAYRFDGGVKIEDETKQNRRLNHNWHKLLVDQKTSYLLGRPVKFSADDVELTAIINKGLGERFDDVLCELSKGASNKGVEWLQLFISEGGGFDFAIIPAEQVIPIWDTSLQKKLVGLIRYYEVSRAVGGSELLVEWWNENSVKHFVRDASGRVDFVKEDCHFYQNGAGFGWGRVPFVSFKNNEEMLNDLNFYKNLVDDYDLCVSDLSNNLAEVQEVVTVLKGYEGTDLREFSENLRYYKVIKVASGDGSGVDKLEISIPIEAKREMLNRLEENIFIFGQGINVKSDKFGNTVSGVALKFLYSLLDMKAGITERKFVVAIKEVLWFLCEYIAREQSSKRSAELADLERLKAYYKNAVTGEGQDKLKQIQDKISSLYSAQVSDDRDVQKQQEKDDLQSKLDRAKVQFESSKAELERTKNAMLETSEQIANQSTLNTINAGNKIKDTLLKTSKIFSSQIEDMFKTSEGRLSGYIDSISSMLGAVGGYSTGSVSSGNVSVTLNDYGDKLLEDNSAVNSYANEIMSVFKNTIRVQGVR